MPKNATAVALLAALSNSADAKPRRVDPAGGAPMLAAYTDTIVHGELWSRPELSQRDRSLITVAALTATGRTSALRFHLGLALDHGVRPNELSELITHVAFYAGWPVGTDAAGELAQVLRDLDLPLEPSDPTPLPLDADKEAARKRSVAAVATLAPGLAHFTDDVLFADVWRRPGLAPRDRSLVTMAVLIALGQAEQMPFHLNRALDNGLTEPEASEVVAHLAFYCGWPRAFSALGPLGSVFQARHPATPAAPPEVTVTPRSEAPHFMGPAANFTGAVEVESLFQADLAGTNGGGMVHFQPGARTAWHTHPRGQTLIVTEGEGWIQQEGKARHTLRTGDVVRIPPNVRHWHGASAESAMSHIAIAESVDGSSVTWMELVPNNAYLGQ
ncbi:MAG: carboxymuconolactone decarboxylase family protein [Myxococcota bacterium]